MPVNACHRHPESLRRFQSHESACRHRRNHAGRRVKTGHGAQGMEDEKGEGLDLMNGTTEGMKIEKSIITSVRTDCRFDTACLTKHTAEMERRMERNIRMNEDRMAAGLKNERKKQARV